MDVDIGMAVAFTAGVLLGGAEIIMEYQHGCNL